MKQLKALAWKEWHEARGFLWIAIGVFIGLPLLGALEGMFQYSRRFELSTSPWVLAFGGVLAVLVAVGATCRDLTGRLEDFWRSRPIGTMRWLLVKYAVGLAIVLAACVLPLTLELLIDRDKDALILVLWFPFLWAALYSIGFLAGCLLRRPAHAAMLALAVMLLVYFLPAVLPPLEWMNATTLTDMVGRSGQWPDVWGTRPVAFAGGMLGLAIIAFVAALVAVWRGWIVSSGRRMMYGSVSVAIVILFASAAFQLGTNLPVLRQTDLPQGESVVSISCSGNAGYVVTRRATLGTGLASEHVEYLFRRFELSPSSIAVIGSTVVSQRYWSDRWTVSPDSRPDLKFDIVADDNEAKEKFPIYLAVSDGGGEKRVMQLWNYDEGSAWPILYTKGDRLFVIGDHLVTLDIGNPLQPRRISETPFRYRYVNEMQGDRFLLNLPPVPDLPARERLQIALRPVWRAASDGDILCVWEDKGLSEYQMIHLSDESATFVKIAHYDPTMLEKVFGIAYSYGPMNIENGLLYVSQGLRQGIFNPHVTVFETRGSKPLRVIGHFAAPEAGVVCPLPDGRALVGGTKLFLIGPPPHRESN